MSAVSPTFTAVKRLGTILSNKIRPILATLQSEDEAIIIKKSAKKLRLSCDANVRDRVYINPHLTNAERTAAYELDALGGKREQNRVFHT